MTVQEINSFLQLGGTVVAITGTFWYAKFKIDKHTEEIENIIDLLTIQKNESTRSHSGIHERINDMEARYSSVDVRFARIETLLEHQSKMLERLVDRFEKI